VIVWIGIILSLFLLKLVFFWRKDWEVKCIATRSTVNEADWVLLKDKYKQCFAHKVHIQVAKETTYNGYAGNNSGVVNDAFDTSNDVTNIDVTFNATETEKTSIQRFFRHQKIKYIFSVQKNHFEKTSSFPLIRCSYFHNTRGLTSTEQQNRRLTFGENAIRVHMTPVIVLLFTQALNPFYVFQLFSILLWTAAEEYYYYAGCIGFLTIVFLAAQIIQQRMMERALKKTISFSRTCHVWKSDINDWREVPSESLVPGDVIQLSDVSIMPCDVVLVSGSCVMNESMLTGESVPVSKVPVSADDSFFDIKEHSRHVLFSGTNVIQMRSAEDRRSPAKAVVYRTGFSTAKGELVRAILFPKPLDFKFTRDSYKYIAFLATMALVGMIYTIVIKVLNGDETKDVVTRTLDLVTIVIPPALPAAMTAGIVFAQFRLRQSRIFCISPNTINVCGSVNCFCFDKTGTLTEDGLDIQSIRQSVNASFDREEISSVEERRHLAPDVLAAMATCHSLAIVNNDLCGDPLDLKMFQFTDWVLEEVDTAGHHLGASTIVHRKTTTLNGDGKQSLLPFSPTSSISTGDEIGIIKQFTFSSRLQRMSVITRRRRQSSSSSSSSSGGAHQFSVFAKGSPEMIASLSLKESVPPDFDDVLISYTRQGFRVIAMATKVLYDDVTYECIDDVVTGIQKITREEVEREFIFLGLLVLENRLKTETTPVIVQLHEANIRIAMVTGDNMLTALSVARGCRMLDDDDHVIMVSVSAANAESPSHVFWCPLDQPGSETKQLQRKVAFERMDMEELEKGKWTSKKHRFSLAITGRSWALLRQHHPLLLPKVVVRGKVFARFSPDQKKQLIEELQKLGYYVGMCGDGANDCGALKAAHAGISLSDAEASVASPFTSKEPNISCVPSLIREGRASLVTSFGVFKYMAGYSMTQFLIVCMLTWPVVNNTLSDFQFLYEDLVLMTPLCFTFCFTGPHKSIAAEAPMISLVAMAPIVSLLCSMSLNLGIIIFSYFYTQAQPWYESADERDGYSYGDGEADINVNYDQTVIFLITCSHFIVMAISFSKGRPHRASFFSNYVFVCNVIFSTACSTIMIFNRWDWWADLLKLKMPPSTAFQAIIFGVSAIHFFVSYLVEMYFVDGFVERWLQPMLSRTVFGETVSHRLIDKELEASADWPPISTKSFAEVIEMEMDMMTTTTGSSSSPPTQEQQRDNDEETDISQLTPGAEVSLSNGIVNKGVDSSSDCDVVVTTDDIESTEQRLLDDDVESDVMHRTNL